jgi:hypothetical protein
LSARRGNFSRHINLSPRIDRLRGSRRERMRDDRAEFEPAASLITAAGIFAA